MVVVNAIGAAVAPPVAIYTLAARLPISASLPSVQRLQSAFTDDGFCIVPCPLLSCTHAAGTSRFVLFASRRRYPTRRGRKQSYDEFDDLDDEYEDDDEDNVGGEGDEPLEEMQRWLQKKPAGFGMGKTYDTRLEDELWEQIEQSRKAQVANLNKLKNDTDRKEDDRPNKPQQQKAIDVVPNGTRVRLWNLPRKKNIHRDLQLAFKGFPGLVNVSPAVIGNEKTRDPICKGFAFVDLKSEEAAQRFVEVYSSKSLAFGKVEKQVNCCIVNPHRSSNSKELPADENTRTLMDIPSNTQVRAKSRGMVVIEESNAHPSLTNNKEDGSIDNLRDNSALIEHVIHDNLNTESWSENEEHSSQSDGALLSLQKTQKMRAQRKKATKQAPGKTSKLSLPGSVSRLKIKERSILTGVFSKYSREVTSESR